MDLDQQLAGEALEYACFLDRGPVVFWLLYKYFNTDRLLSRLSASCKKRVSCQLLYWVVKGSKVVFFRQCLTILQLLKEDHPDVCHQQEWTKLELGIKLKIVLQEILNGSSQSQCLETFNKQFPDFEEDKTEFSDSEEHLLQLLFRLICRPSIVTGDDAFQNEVGSKLIHAIRHRVKHLMENLNQTLPRPQLEKARLDMWCVSGKPVKDFEKFSEKKKKFCEFLQKIGNPTTQQLLEFMEGRNYNELNYDQKVEVVERIWCSIPCDPRSIAKSTPAKRKKADSRTLLSISIIEKGKPKKLSFYCQGFLDFATESKLSGQSDSRLEPGRRNMLKSKPVTTTTKSVTRLRPSSLISKRGRDNGHVKSVENNSKTLPSHASGKSRQNAVDSAQHDGKNHGLNLGENWSQVLQEGKEAENTDSLTEFHQVSDCSKGQVDDAEKLISRCINSKSVVKLKKFKSPESVAMYGKQTIHSGVLSGEHLTSELSKTHKTLNDKEDFPEIIVLSDSEKICTRSSSRLRSNRKRNANTQNDSLYVSEDIRETVKLSLPRNSSLNCSSNSSLNCAGSVRTSGNSNQSSHSPGEDFTDCRENVHFSSDSALRDLCSRNNSEMQIINLRQKGGGNGVSPGTEEVVRKRKKRNEKPSEEKETGAFTSDSDGKESSEEMIIVGSSYSQSLRKLCGNNEEILNKKAEDGARGKLLPQRRRLRSTCTHRRVEVASGRDAASLISKAGVVEDEKEKRESRSSSHQQKSLLESPDGTTMENANTSKDPPKECSENVDMVEMSPVSTHKGESKSPWNGIKQSGKAFGKSGVSSPVFEYKHSSGSSSDKSVSLLTGRRVLFTPDDELIPNVSMEMVPEVSQENVTNYPIDLSELVSPPDKRKEGDSESRDQVRSINSSNSHISSGSEVNSDQVKVIAETPPESPDRILKNVSMLEVSPSCASLILQSLEDPQSDCSSLQHAQRQQTHSFSKSSSDDVNHVSDSEDEEEGSLHHNNSENHPRFPSLVQYLSNETAESPLRSCSVVLHKIKFDKLRLRVLLSQDTQEKS